MKYSVILLISILFVGCKSDKKDYIRCDEVRTILSFPEEIELKNPSVVPVDLTGCVDIIQADYDEEPWGIHQERTWQE